MENLEDKKELKSLITVTFSERVQNHTGMEIIGKEIDQGFRDLEQIYQNLKEKGISCELVDLKGAFFLIIRNGLNLCGVNNEEIHKELLNLKWDSKVIQRGKVVEKTLRHLLCFDDFSQQPDIENGKGTVINFNELPLLQKVRNNLPEFFGEKASQLKAEGNNYFDITSTGVGWHGDSERKIVIGVRIGEGQFPLFYQWYYQNEQVRNRFKVEVNPGDIYLMDEKASGNDWKNNEILTLRHATGSQKFIDEVLNKKKKSK